MNYEQKFALAESSGEEGSFVRIDETHPVGIFLGIESGCRTVMIICLKRPSEPPSMAAIGIDIRPRQNGEWALVLRLIRPDLKALFTHLVEDLDSATRRKPEDPGEVVLSRLSRWQRLLSRGVIGLLEDRELRGLSAELDFLLGEAFCVVGARAALAAWVGPYDAPKDFAFKHAEVEVKAVHKQSREVQVSSLEQLTDSGLPLYLWTRVVELGDAAPGDNRSFTSLIDRVRAAVSNDSVAAESLEECLRMAGYEDRSEYSTRSVTFGATSCFRVSGQFPRIQRPDVVAAVRACRYDLAVADLEQFRVGTWREAPLDAR